MDKIQKINELIGDRTYLISDRLYKLNIETIKVILELPEWSDPKYKRLLTSTIWESNIEDVKKILSMSSKWSDPKFQDLLTPAIWKSNAKKVKTILEMPEWSEPKYQCLLTSSVWLSNVEDIKTILSMPEWDNPKYQHLLKPSIFNISLKNIRPSIKLFESYEIGEYITNRCLRRNVKQQEVLLEYLVEHKIDLVEKKKDGEYRINPILSASNDILKKKYGIDIKVLQERAKQRGGRK